MRRSLAPLVKLYSSRVSLRTVTSGELCMGERERERQIEREREADQDKEREKIKLSHICMYVYTQKSFLLKKCRYYYVQLHYNNIMHM